MDWYKIILAIVVLIGSQLALKYGNGLLASLIASLPVIAFVTYFSALDRQKVALQLSVFLAIVSLTFLVIYLLPQRFFFMGIIFWIVASIIVYKFIF